jgi:hypothetical protein
MKPRRRNEVKATQRESSGNAQIHLSLAAVVATLQSAVQPTSSHCSRSRHHMQTPALEKRAELGISTPGATTPGNNSMYSDSSWKHIFIDTLHNSSLQQLHARSWCHHSRNDQASTHPAGWKTAFDTTVTSARKGMQMSLRLMLWAEISTLTTPRHARTQASLQGRRLHSPAGCARVACKTAAPWPQRLLHATRPASWRQDPHSWVIQTARTCHAPLVCPNIHPGRSRPRSHSAHTPSDLSGP